MKFISIKNYDGDDVAINVKNITAIKLVGSYVSICIGGDIPIATQFTNVGNAVDYIQRAPSMSLKREVA